MGETKPDTAHVPKGIYLELPRQVLDMLSELHGTGLFGITINEVIERLVCERLVELTQDGWLELPHG